MFPRGIKINIVITLAVLLITAMLLTDFIFTIKTQQDLVRAETSKGYMLLSIMEDRIWNRFNIKEKTFGTGYDLRIDRIFSGATISGLIVLDSNRNELYNSVSDSNLSERLKTLAGEVINSGERKTDFWGETWGVFWKQKREIILSVPFIREGRVYAGASIALPLTHIYKSLRYTQQILLFYILINTFILTFAGVYRLSKVYLQPLLRLVKRAEEYKDDDEMFFSVRKEDDELSKLSTALNRMLNRISEDKEKLRSTVMSLEKANIDLKQAQNEIIRAEKLASVGRLSSGIAHEIGNPIGIVIGYLDLLKQENLPMHEKSEYIGRAEAEINRINKIIRQLLDQSRFSPKELCAVPVHEIISEITNVLRPQPIFENTRIKLIFNAEKDIVFADADQLKQVFLNLMMNAADAISSAAEPLAGEVKIQTDLVSGTATKNSNQPDTLKIMFIDNGAGIPKENLANVFDPFFTTKEPGKGTGLGLSVSFMIIESISGTINVTSGHGSGTTMTIRLPLYMENGF